MDSHQFHPASHNKTPRDIVILGAGGYAREVASVIKAINLVSPYSWNFLGYCGTKNDPIGTLLNGYPILDSSQIVPRAQDLYVIAAIGDPHIRERAVHEAELANCKFATLIHPSAKIMDEETISIGPGTSICADCILTVNIQIHAHVVVNLDCTIGHDCILEDFVTLSPGCHLSGYTTIRRSAFLGIGAVTIEKREIGTSAKIGAGAVVIKDIPPNVTAVGIPAQVVRRD